MWTRATRGIKASMDRRALSIPYRKGEIDLSGAVQAPHGLGEIRAGRQASGIDASHRRAEPALATENLVGETDHSRIGPRLRSDPQESIDDGVLALVRKRLRQYHRHGRGGAGDARVAMDQEMAKIRA